MQYKKKALQNKWVLFLLSMRMSKKTLKFDNCVVNNCGQIILDKFKHSDDGFKYFIGYKEYDIVKPLCII